jgi:hypothetical protein
MYKNALPLFIAITACVLLLTSGCVQETDTAGVPEFTRDQIADFVIKPGEGWGPIMFSTSKAQVERMLGAPERRSGEYALEYMSLGMAITVDKSNKVNQILFGNVCASSHEDSLIQACRFKTAEGIGMLSTDEEIRAAYGEPSGLRGESEVEELQYRELGTIFTLRNSRLVHISIRSPYRK